MLRRLHAQQPDAFAFTPANLDWARAQMAKYPEGRQASAVIPLLFRAQEQEGWLSKPAIEAVAGMLGMAYIRVLEVATFYFMFQLAPVGSVAHVQVCGTLPCMLRGSEDLMALCQRRIGRDQHHPSADGRFSWEEVECLGACANAPMAQIGKDYYEDLTPERLGLILDELAAGRVPPPGPQDGRFASEPAGGPTTLTQWVEGRQAANASVELATVIGDTVKRIDGTEVPLRSPWLRSPEPEEPEPVPIEEAEVPTPGEGTPVDESGISVQQAPADSTAKPPGPSNPDGGDPRVAPEPEGSDMTPPGGVETTAGPVVPAEVAEAGPDAPLVPEQPPATLTAPRDGRPDDLTAITGIGPKVAARLNELGFFHYDQIASWGPGEVAWVNSRLGPFRGRVERDDWIGQARRLSGG
jgi:NADH-quinone oxidoreductase subunit E